MIRTLFPELFQTERSASRHPVIEAERLGAVPPAAAMRAVATHASAVLERLPGLAEERGLSTTSAGTAIGTLFSIGRDRFADLLLDAERSYRGTLLGMRHGVDLVRLLRSAALSQRDAPLAAFCTEWLTAREPLVEAVAVELAWFAAHPERALARAKRLFGRAA